MTRLGKILVVLNVTLSLLMAAWAVGIYTNHIRWGLDKSVQETEAEVTRLHDRLVTSAKGAGLFDDLASAESRWKSANPVFQTIEPMRERNQKWFAAQLEELRTSTKAVKMPASENGQLKIDQTPQNFGLPVMVEATDKGGRQLLGLEAYQKEYADRQEAIKVAMNELKTLLAEDEKLTRQIGGPADQGGLRALLTLEGDKKQRVLTEQDYLRPLLVNSLVEGELLEKRQADLEARVKQLQANPVASSR